MGDEAFFTASQPWGKLVPLPELFLPGGTLLSLSQELYLGRALGPWGRACGSGAAGHQPSGAPTPGAASSPAGRRAGLHPPGCHPPGEKRAAWSTQPTSRERPALGREGTRPGLALSSLQGLLPKSRVQESTFEGLLGAHAPLPLMRRA